LVFSSHIFLFWFLPLSLLLYYAVPVRARAFRFTVLTHCFKTELAELLSEHVRS
jgi:alginate O-acetyltransferase complex protein AlgI